MFRQALSLGAWIVGGVSVGGIKYQGVVEKLSTAPTLRALCLHHESNNIFTVQSQTGVYPMPSH